jgi:hypothetical protein
LNEDLLSKESLSVSDIESSASEPQDMIDSDPDEENEFNTDFDKDNDLPLAVTQISSLPSSQSIPPDETDHDKPNNLTRVSAIRSGLNGLKDGLKPQGLLKFWKRGTDEDRNNFFEREDERHNEWMEKEKYSSDRKKQVQTDLQRERARLRKQKSRARMRESKNGEKKKRVRNNSDLQVVKCT